MAQTTTKSEILRLTAKSAAARATLQAEIGRLRHRFDVPARVRDSVKENPSRWFLGTTAAGLASALLLPRFLVKRKQKPAKKTSHNSKALAFAWTIARPVLKSYLTAQLRTWILQQGQRAITSKQPKPKSAN